MATVCLQAFCDVGDIVKQVTLTQTSLVALLPKRNQAAVRECFSKRHSAGYREEFRARFIKKGKIACFTKVALLFEWSISASS